MKHFSPILHDNADLEKSLPMTKLKSFQIRALSALVAVAVIIALYYFLNVLGLKILVGFAVVVGIWELTQILFKDESSKTTRLLFALAALMTFGGTVLSLGTGALVFSLSTIFLVIATLLQHHQSGDLQRMTILHTKASLGLLYVGLLPAFAYRILEHNHGVAWFVFLLAVVFAGDTLAYLTGVLIGRNKVMPSVSPKKTWEGSIGGLVGSVLAGLICWLFLFPEQNLSPLLVLAGLAGFVGQFGDFFESLLKRVANVKDSGWIMPGHGGVLDRLDAVLFASPVILAGILLLSYYSI